MAQKQYHKPFSPLVQNQAVEAYEKKIISYLCSNGIKKPNHLDTLGLQRHKIQVKVSIISQGQCLYQGAYN